VNRKTRDFKHVGDGKNFVERLGKIATDSKTAVYAWTLMRNVTVATGARR
jgi:hypothetical protein